MAVTKDNPVLDALWERVCAIFDTWTDLLDLGWTDITLVRCDTTSDDDGNTAADTEAKWQYRQAIVRVFLPAISDHTDADIERILVHELSHILVNPMESLLPRKHTDNCELATENVARALLALHKVTT